MRRRKKWRLIPWIKHGLWRLLQGRKPDRRATASRLARALSHVAPNEQVVLDMISLRDDDRLGGWHFTDPAAPWLRVLNAYALTESPDREPVDVLGMTLNTLSMTVGMDPTELTLDHLPAYAFRVRLDDDELTICLFPVVFDRRAYTAYLEVRGTGHWLRKFKTPHPLSQLGLHYRIPGIRWRLFVKANSETTVDRLLPVLLLGA